MSPSLLTHADYRHKTLKGDAIRIKCPSSLEEDYYNETRLHSAIGYIAPADRVHGRQVAIWAERDRKLIEALWVPETLAGSVHIGFGLKVKGA
jgi:hypothetical protein